MAEPPVLLNLRRLACPRRTLGRWDTMFSYCLVDLVQHEQLLGRCLDRIEFAGYLSLVQPQPSRDDIHVVAIAANHSEHVVAPTLLYGTNRP